MNKWILGVSVILFLLTSCSKDNDEGTPQSDDIMNGGAELKFSSDVLSSIVVDVDPTRSSTRAPLSSFENNSQIGIYGIPGVDGPALTAGWSAPAGAIQVPPGRCAEKSSTHSGKKGKKER